MCIAMCIPFCSITLHSLFFFNATATTEIYTLSLHDALPIFSALGTSACQPLRSFPLNNWTGFPSSYSTERTDRKSTRLNSSHQIISYAVFCLKKKKYQRH